MKMWGGRFDREPDREFFEFTSSLSFDQRLYRYDIKVTKAWAGELAKADVLTSEEKSGIQSALEKIEAELDSGAFEFQPTDEDIHTAIERRLCEMMGPAGGKVRTGRSRNDQVATDMRLLVIDESGQVAALIRVLQGTLLEKARQTLDLAVPGHTHLQQAQPVLMAQLLLAFLFMLERDHRRVRNARAFADSMPLGAGALAGTGLGIDREALAEELGFSQPSPNSVDAVSDRDFVCDLLFALSMSMIHLSRLAEQIILWCSQEFALVELDDAWATGSSLMPQKKNPDGPELVRAKTGRVLGSLVAMMTVLKGLPLAYNRDLQEDKEALFDAFETTAGCLSLLERTVATMVFNPERAAELLAGGFTTATDLADYLVQKGVEFPEAHRIVGEVVMHAVKERRSLNELTFKELQSFSDALDEGAMDYLSVDSSIGRRGQTGGTSRRAVEKQIADGERMISGV